MLRVARMLRMFRPQWFVLAAGVSLFTGCAFSRTETPVNFTPKVVQPLSHGSRAELQMGEVKDSRTVSDANVVIHKANAYGTTTGAYISKLPVAEIFKNGLLIALKENGFTASRDRKLILACEIQDFELESISGLWKVTVKPKLTVRFDLVESNTQKRVWNDTYIGRTTIETSMESAKLIGDLWVGAASNVVDQLVNDSAFRKNFE